jgi:transposase
MRKLGQDVRLISPQCVTPYQKSHKNDPNSAAAICEAVRRPSMRFVLSRRSNTKACKRCIVLASCSSNSAPHYAIRCAAS